jgi:hypothetical protein
LIQKEDDYDVWQLNQRTPEINDTGMVIEILHADGLPDKYVVEKTGPEGETIWMSEFFEEEIEPEGA